METEIEQPKTRKKSEERPRINIPGWASGDPLVSSHGYRLDSMYRVRIAPASEKNVAQVAQVPVNGINWAFRRGEDVEMPGYVLAALADAKAETFRQVRTPSGEYVHEPFTESAYEFSVMGEVQPN